MLGPGHVVTTCLCDTGQVSFRSRDVYPRDSPCSKLLVWFLVEILCAPLQQKLDGDQRSVCVVFVELFLNMFTVESRPKKTCHYHNHFFVAQKAQSVSYLKNSLILPPRQCDQRPPFGVRNCIFYINSTS